jgi:hypothetical protein
MQMNIFNHNSNLRSIFSNHRTANIYEQEWNEAMMKLANSRHRLSAADEEAIKKIANKL